MRKKIPIWIYSVPAFNRLVDFYFRHRLTGALALPATPWRHPWHTTVRWSELAQCWLATVKPGACPSASSDGDPVVRVDQINAPPETVARLELEPGGTEKNLSAYLSEGAPMALRPDLFRAIGTDATGTDSAPGESVPAFFAARGVMGPRVLRDNGGSAVLASDGLEIDRRNARLLRACDLVLMQDRVATVTSLRESDMVEGNTALEFSLARATSYDPDPQLVARAKWESPADLAALDLATGSGTDPGRDERLIATVYLLSDPGMEEGSLPTGPGWTPFVDHFVFWDLQHATRFATLEVEPTRLEMPFGFLAAGELGRFSKAFTNDLNGRIAEMEAALSNVRNEGRFLMM